MRKFNFLRLGTFFGLIFLLIILFFPWKIFPDKKISEKQTGVLPQKLENNLTNSKKEEKKEILTIKPDNTLDLNSDFNFAKEEILPPKIIIPDVPFYVQAPFKKWEEDIFQSGCEESSLFMAMDWILGKEKTEKKLESDLREITDWELKRFGTSMDTSLPDTGIILKEYFNFSDFFILKLEKIENIITQLEKGYLVLIPTNGRELKNPYYTPPGPQYHMIVILGFDREKNEFITHDPGTRRGANFYYPAENVWRSIASYETGYDEPRKEIIKEALIIKN